MWFKNLALYRLTEDFDVSADELNDKMEAQRFRECGKMDVQSYGWVSPLGGDHLLVHQASGFIMLCAQTQEKVLPHSVVNELTAEKIEAIENQDARKLTRKERSALKDEVIFQLLPQAFSFKKKLFAYIDVKEGWIVVDSAASGKAEDMLSLLRKSLGSLPVVPLNTQQSPTSVMTRWLQQQLPADIVINDEAELLSVEREGATIRCKRHDLTTPHILQLLENNMQVNKLAIEWSERLTCVLDANLAVKRLKFTDLVLEKAGDINSDSDIERFDADFSIMTLELRSFLNRLVELFGGENVS